MPRTGFYPQRGQNWSQPKPPSTKAMTFPAPAKGINAADPMATLGLEYCTTAINLIPDGRGMRVRSGYYQYATGFGTDVRTIIPFQGGSTTNDALFGVTDTGIYNITSGGAGPWVADVTFPSTGGDAGWGIWTTFTSDAGTHYSFLADEANGLYRRPEAGAWAAVTDITGVSELDIVHVMEHKSRLWLTQKGTSDAWYLASGAISGAATVFHFGSKFQHGGTLIGLWNWTVDGGDGIDDYLVAMSTAGDVVVYRFTDPADFTTFTQTAQYYIGAIPLGRRAAYGFGGELFLLSQYGVLPMSKLVSGRPVQEQDIYASRNITPLLTADMTLLLNQRGWELKGSPSENVLLLSTPKVTALPYKQYALSSKTNGWGIFNDVQYFCGETYASLFYIGGEDGVNVLAGTTDNVDIVTAVGTPITFSILTAFSDLGEMAMFHRAQFIRPVFRTGGGISYDAEPRYDYNTDDYVPSLVAPAISGAIWDTAIWDVGLWGTDSVTVDRVVGGFGIGRAVGVVLTGQSSSITTLLRIDVLFDTGSFL